MPRLSGKGRFAKAPMVQAQAIRSYSRADSENSVKSTFSKDYIIPNMQKKAPSRLNAQKIVGYAGHVPGSLSFRDTIKSNTSDDTSDGKYRPKRPCSAPLGRALYTTNSKFVQGFRSAASNQSNLIFGDDRLWTRTTSTQSTYGRNKESPERLSPEKRHEMSGRRRC